jgi:SpoVK/Ycf46/Vps4 family AAA+-type ATPase
MSFLGNKAQMNKSVTLDGLLNALDGVHRGTQKRIMIATTNYPEKLIPSIRRRGRFGQSLKIDYPREPELAEMFKYYLPQINRTDIMSQIRAVEQSLGLRLSTAAAVDILAKESLDRAKPTPPSTTHKDLATSVVNQIDASLRELEQNNRKRLDGTHQLLSLLGLEKCGGSFHDQGLVDLRYVKLLNDHELKDIGITRLGDRKKLLDSFQYMEDTPALSGDALQKAKDGLRAMRDSEENLFDGVAKLLKSVFDEKQAAELEEKFNEQGLAQCTLAELQKLSAGDLEKEEFGLKKLGDRHRLLLAIGKLREP